MKQNWQLLLVVAVGLSTVSATPCNSIADAPCVSGISPMIGSINGATRVTIQGYGFVDDLYTQTIDVYMVSDTQQVNSSVHQDGCTETQIMVYTEPMVEGYYYVRVYLNGVPVLEDSHCNGATGANCRFQTAQSHTPTISMLSTHAHTPGNNLLVEGTIFTSLYGTNEGESTNGRLARFTRVWTSSGLCDLVDENGEFTDTGLQLDGEEGEEDTGYFECMPQGTYVGNQNITFIINDTFGRSLADNALMRVMPNNDLAMFETYAEIASLSHSMGSTAGGAPLVISGTYFDDTASHPQVTIGGVQCEDVTLSDDFSEIHCTTPEEPAAPSISGNRGISLLIWNITDSHTDDDETVRNYTSPDVEEVIDDFYFSDETLQAYSVAVMTGVFVAPSSNTYKFLVRADDNAVLYFSTSAMADDATEAARVNSYNYDNNHDAAETADVDLAAGQEVYLELIVRNAGGAMAARVSAHMYDTVYTSSQSGQVLSEIHSITTGSSEVNEVQRITLNDWVVGEGQEAIQSFVISLTDSDPAGCYFMIRLFGAYTEMISVDAQSSDIKTKLMQLPYFSNAETLNDPLKEETTQTSWKFTIGFRFLGRYPMIDVREVRVVGGECEMDISALTEEQAGTSSGQSIVPFYRGVPGTPIPASQFNANTLKESLTELFSVQCPSHITSPAGSAYTQDFEGDSGSGYAVTSEYAPFCGRAAGTPRWSSQTHFDLYDAGFNEDGDWNDGIAGTRSMMCFAYRGHLGDSIWVRYVHDNNEYRLWISVSLMNFFAIYYPDTYYVIWNYECLNLFSLIQEQNEDISSAAGLHILEVRVYNEDDTREYPMLIDSISFTQNALVADPTVVAYYQRMQTSWVAETIDVTAVDDTTFDVTIETIECASNLALISFEFGELSALSSSASTWTFSNGQDPTPSISVTRQSAASPPITGTVVVGNNVQSDVTVDASMEAADVESGFESHGYGDVTVEREGDCSGYEWTIEYTSVPGDRADLMLQSDYLNGFDTTVVVETAQDGGVHWDPIPGNLMRTTHDEPQVVVAINGIPCSCTTDCSFEWYPENTPTVDSISPTSGSYGDSVVISGERFSTTEAENVVMIGQAVCIVTDATATQITCTVGEGIPGPRDVAVVVTTIGAAVHSSPVQFTYNFAVTGVSPTSGYTSGGAIVTIDGSGFGNEVTVTIGSNDCQIIDNSYTDITCLAPSGNAGAQAVVVSENGVDGSGSHSFTYTNPSASISGLSTNVANVAGDTELTITGSGLGLVQYGSGVTVGDMEADVQSYSDTEVVAILPVMGTGTYTLNVNVDASGYASRDTNTDIEYILRVDNVYPRQGSLMGGQKVTITGQGFSTAVAKDIMFDESACVEESVTDTEIICQLDYATTVYSVTNQGTHQPHGTGYAWSPNYITIEKGDFIEFEWTTPDTVTAVGYRVFQVASDQATTPMTGGFISSSASTGNGVYKYQFTQTGTYYYYSGPITGSFGMAGTVVVTNKDNYYQYLSLMIGTVEADYDTASGVADPVDSSDCSPLLAIPAGCDDVRGDDSALFDMAMWQCMTPTITGISPSTVIANQDITITGTGFGTACQNEVLIEPGVLDVECVVSSATATQIVCSIPPQCEGLPSDVYLSLQVRVNNYGYAIDTQLAKTDRGIMIGSSVSSISPTLGSTQGGQLVTLIGDNLCYQCDNTCERRRRRSNLQDAINLDERDVTYYDTAVSVCDGYVSVAPDMVVCETRALGLGAFSAYVSTQMLDGTISESTCDGGCLFTQSLDYTPTITSLDPTSITANNEVLSLTGTNLGTDPNAIHIEVGDTECMVQAVVNNGATQTVTCDVGEPLGGAQSLMVMVDDFGYGFLSQSYIDVTRSITSLTPNTVGTVGGALVAIDGVGFDADDYSITVDGTPCTDTSFVSRTQLTCSVPAVSAGSVDVAVTTGGATVTASLTVTSSGLPTITIVSPTEAVSGELITITGTNLNDPIVVSIGGADCAVQSADGTTVTCLLGDQAAGTYDIELTVTEVGTASGSVQFTYELSVSGVSPVSGSFGGGQTVEITGRGFNSAGMSVTICGNDCEVNADSVTPTSIMCVTPPNAGSGSLDCDVIVTDDTSSTEESTADAYEYTGSARVTAVNPVRGGTGGGTRITIDGTGFGTNMADIEVTIAGTECVLDSVADAEIVCVTEAHSPAVETQVQVHIADSGIAYQASADYQYIDVWSSEYTWGGDPVPSAGEFVVIPENMTVLLDESTPVLKLLLINGGKLIFENTVSSDILLQAEIIFVANGGTFQVGTEAEPYLGQATIELHGHVRSKELPIYGTKVLAVRQGTLDLHGTPTTKEWTLLDGSVSAGVNQITLEHAVDWQAGDEIVIATTGDRFSQGETEQHTISSVTNGGTTLTLGDSLSFDHLGEDITFDGRVTLAARAEVGLLTRNIVFRGNDDTQWHDEIDACEAGFNPGEFSTQTCFQGRHGEEIGSNQFGAQILMHAPDPDQHDLLARIANVELTFVGQAFRLGRYAIHFHLLGDMAGSYVRSCAIHKSFNRAVNIHGTHNVLVEKTVAYNIMGGAFFLEDGIETGNTFQYNLALFVISSTSLQNDDITPAAFWVTNPNNTYQHNHAAGGTHFGFWYRMHEHPDGPSFDPNYCPRKIPMGSFANNTVHSQGWFGIWIFQVFTPVETGCCSCTIPAPAHFYTLTAWHCEKGAEWVGGGAIQWIDFLLVNNEKAGIEMKMILEPAEPYSETHGALISGGTIVAYDTSGVLPNIGTRSGIIMPYARGLIVKDIEFMNFVDNNVCYGVTQIDGRTQDKAGGFLYQLSTHTFTNTDNRIGFRWEHEAVFKDLDGTLTGEVGKSVIPCTGILSPADCSGGQSQFDVGVAGCVCAASMDFHRFSFNHYSPSSLEGKNVSFTNEHGTSITPFKKKRMTHKLGWMIILPSRDSYQMAFVNAEQLVNISYDGVMYDFSDNDWVVVTYEFYQRPDAVNIIPGGDPDIANSSDPVTYGVNYHGDFYIEDFDPRDSTNNTASVMTLMSDRDRGNSTEDFVDRPVTLDVYRCYYEGCIVPPDPDSLPPSDTRPDWAVYWSDAATWSYNAETDSYQANSTNEEDTRRRREVSADGLPAESAEITIEEGAWVVLDVENLPQFNRIWVFGVLEFEWEGNLDLSLSATHIFVSGGRLIVGWENHPISGSATIELRGNYYTDDINIQSAPNIGSKVIACFGGCDMHGEERTTAWTQLSAPAAIGDTTVTLNVPVDWQEDDEIVIATTSFAPMHSEVRVITDVSDDGRTVSFSEPLEYNHIASVEELGSGNSFNMSAEVGLLTRNVKIYGKDYDDEQMADQGFGGRMFVSVYASSESTHTGYARLSNVQFSQMGQEGWSDFYDPRYALAYLDTGDVTLQKPSYVKKCTFHDNYNTAFGAFGANGLVFEDNVIHKTVGSSVRMWDQHHSIRNNLVMGMMYPGTWNNRNEFRFSWYALMDITNTNNVTLEGNHLAGGERGGYRVDGEVCGETSQWNDNVAHSALQGVFQLADEGDGIYPCTYLHGFRTWKIYDFAIYSVITGSLEVEDHISIDDNIGMYGFIYNPSATSHGFENKYIQVRNSDYVGFSSVSSCTDSSELIGNREFNKFLEFSSLSRGMHPTTPRKTGITWPTFMSGPVPAPLKPFIIIKTYQAIRGKMTVQDVSFKNYDMRCEAETSISAYAFQASTSNDDAIHPVYTRRITLVDVADSNIAYIPTPNVGKINPSDCVDMDCDGLKKVLLFDQDGSLLGETGTIFARSEFEWDGDARRGTGDYRIPLTMLTDTDGNRLYVQDMASYVGKGIVREQAHCLERETAYNGWVCEGEDSPQYHMLMLESMDSDTETRRVSPVGIRNINEAETYFDLINGPQDHGWCMGYTCQKRLSTFPIVFAANKSYELHFTGTTPQHLRFHWLNPEEYDSGNSIVLGIWYANPHRLDIMMDGEYVDAVNGYYNDDDQLLFNSGNHMLDPASVSAGENWFERDTGIQWIALKGDHLIDIVTSPLIFVNFDIPFQSVDEFFGENIVNNFASFFDIPEANIRVATAVRESSRRKRTDVIQVTVEISNPPHDLDVTDPSDLTTEELQSIAAAIIDTYQLGELDDILELTILSLTVTQPVPDPDSDEWRYVVELETGTEVTVQLPDSASIEVAPLAQHEGAPFRVQPAVRTYDANGDAVESLGSIDQPWEMTAYLFHIDTMYGDAELIGNETVSNEEGWFNFTDLGISHAGEYQIQFMVTSPEGASHLRVISEVLTIADRALAVLVMDAPANTTESESFDVTVALADAFTGEAIEDIAWRGHTWEATVALYSAITYPGHMNVSMATGTVDPSTGTVTFSDISIHTYGRYYLQFRLVSSPAYYDVAVPSDVYIDVFPHGYTAPTSSGYDRLTIKFSGNYEEVAYGYEDFFATAVYNELFDRFMDLASFDNFEVYEGSIMVDFDITGNEDDVEDVIEEIYELVSDGLDVTLNSVTVSTTGEFYVNDELYGEDEEKSKEKDDDGLPLWAIVLIAIAGAAFVLCLMAFLVYVIYSKKRINYQVKKLEEQGSKKRRNRIERRDTVFMNEMEDGKGDYFYNVKGTTGSNGSYSNSSTSLQSRYGDEDLMVASAAPNATAYIEPPKSDKFDFVNVRPRSSYNPPGRLPSLGANKPKTPDSVVSASALRVDDGMRAPGTPDFGRLGNV